MRKTRLNVMAVMLLAIMLLVPGYSFAKAKKPAAAPKVSAKAVDLRLALRDLWTDHIFWVRNVVVMTKLGDAAAAKVAEENAVQNAKNIANSIAPFYGKDASEKLFGLLAGHYGGIKDYMAAAFAGNKEGKDAAVGKLKKNGEEIATFLNSANPNWPKDAVLAALVAHVGHHVAQIEALAAKDYAADAQTWEAMKKQVYGIADVLADGIVKQFPVKFRK